MWSPLLPTQLIVAVLLAVGCLMAFTAEAATPVDATFAERRLRQVIEKEALLFARLEDNQTLPAVERQRLLTELARNYESILADSPDYVYAYILYGKMLRRIGEYERANYMFVKANDLNPRIAVVKQQIGNFLAEKAEFGPALAYYMAAVELEPETAIYHYCVGELLHEFREEFLTEGGLDRQTLDRNLLEAFSKAAALEPENRSFATRLAEAHLDVESPDYPQALALWDALLASTSDPLEADLIRLQIAALHLKMSNFEEAGQLAALVTRESLTDERERLLDQITAQKQGQ